MKQYGAEFLGTFWLVLGGCGSAVLAAAFPNVGIGLHGVSLAFGLSAYTRLDGMITTNTSDLNTYLAHSADYEQITVSTVPVQTAE